MNSPEQGYTWKVKTCTESFRESEKAKYSFNKESIEQTKNLCLNTTAVSFLCSLFHICMKRSSPLGKILIINNILLVNFYWDIFQHVLFQKRRFGCKKSPTDTLAIHNSALRCAHVLVSPMQYKRFSSKTFWT